MTDQHRATPEQWEHVEICAEMKQQVPWATADCILELRARVEALEATQHAHADVSRLSDAERERLTQELAKPAAWRPLDIETTYGSEAAADAAQILHAPMVVEGTFDHGGETYRYKAKPEREAPMTEPSAASAEVRPAASEIFPVEYADSNGDGIRIIMEPADETGRVCWVVRNSRRVDPIHEFPTPEAAYAAHQARPAVKESLTDGTPLLEMVAKAIYNVPPSPSAEASAAIREVAAWLDRFALHGSGEYAQAAKVLRQEANHG